MRLTQEVLSSMLLAVLIVFTEMCSETIAKMHNIWVLDEYAFSKKKAPEKIASRTVDNRVTEKENVIPSSAAHQSVSHIFYHFQLNLYHLLNSRPLPRCLWLSGNYDEEMRSGLQSPDLFYKSLAVLIGEKQ